MDVTLERILVLLPKDKNGKIKHGAKKEFAMSLGYESGDIVSMWIKGTSVSYRNYLHQIADKYNVSVAWLMGETDVKEKSPAPGMSAELSELVRLFDAASPEAKAMALAALRAAVRPEGEE